MTPVPTGPGVECGTSTNLTGIPGPATLSPGSLVHSEPQSPEGNDPMSRTERKTACNYTNTVSSWLAEAVEHGDTRHGASTLPYMPRAIRHHLRVDQRFKGWGPGHTGLQLKVPDRTCAVLIPGRRDRVGSRLTRQLSQAKADAHLLTALAFRLLKAKGLF